MAAAPRPAADARPSVSPATLRARERRATRRMEEASATVQAEEPGPGGPGGMPFLPDALATPALYRAAWFGEGKVPFIKAREMLRHDDFVGGIHAVKLGYFHDGFRVGGVNARWRNWLAKTAYAFERVARDAWTEWLLQDNIVAFWMRPEPGSGRLPAVLILDCEICDYSNRLGVEVLTIKPRPANLQDAEKAALGPRWAAAYAEGKQITLDPAQGECFRVLTRAKLGNGLGMPRLRQVFTQLSAYELLKTGDWSGAWAARDVIRHWKKGHEIKTGDLAGDPRHFITPKAARAMMAGIRDKHGFFDLMTNFDVDADFVYLDAAFFDRKKFTGIAEQLDLWAGPAALMRREGTLSPYLMDMFEKEGTANRQLVGGFLAGLFNDPDFLGGVKPPGPLNVSFNPRSFLSQKLLLQWVSAGVPNGIVSPQTGREAMGVSDEEESQRMADAHGRPKDFTPVFEAKQGMLAPNEGGRPSDNPATGTPPAGAVVEK